MDLPALTSYMCVWSSFIIRRRYGIIRNCQSSLLESLVGRSRRSLYVLSTFSLRSTDVLSCFSAIIHDQTHHPKDCVAVKANKPGFTNTLESFWYQSPKMSEQDASRRSEIDVLRDQFNVLQRSVEASQETILEMMAKLLNSQGQEERNESGGDTQNALPTAGRRLAEGTSAGDMHMHGSQ